MRPVWTRILRVLALTLALPGSATAQEWPAKQAIKVIVPFTAGSATDIIARAVFESVGRQVGQSAIVENRGGGGTTIGANAVAKAEPDGYTLLVSSTSHVVVATTFPNLPYSVTDDFAGISALAFQPFTVTTRTRYKTLADLVAFGRANPSALNYGSAGIGTSGMLFMEQLALAGKMKMTHVPFRGTPEAMTEIVADRLDLYPGPVASVMELAAAGRLNVLAVSTPKRATAMPDVPTTTEAGLTGAEYIFWIGAFAPAKTPKPVLERLHGEVLAALAAPDVVAKIVGLGADPSPMSMPEFDAFARREIKVNADIFIAAGIKGQ